MKSINSKARIKVATTTIIMVTHTTTTTRNHDDAIIDGDINTKRAKTIPEMSNIWETTLTGEDHGCINKAIQDYCVVKNITTKDFFMKYTIDQREAGWKEITKVLPPELILKINDILKAIDPKKYGDGVAGSIDDAGHTATATTNNIASGDAATINSDTGINATALTPSTTNNTTTIISVSAGDTGSGGSDCNGIDGIDNSNDNNNSINININDVIHPTGPATTTTDINSVTNNLFSDNTMNTTSVFDIGMGANTPSINPTNDLLFAGLFGLTIKEKKAFRKNQLTWLRKNRNLNVVIDENAKLLEGKGDEDIIVTPPEKKPAIVKEDNMKPAFTIGQFVKVARDFSSGKARPEGYGHQKPVGSFRARRTS